MKILLDSDDAQTVKFIPRELYTGNGFAKFTDKTTKELFTYTVTMSEDRYYNQFTVAMPDLIEGHTYTASFGYGDIETYRGYVLCTNQGVDYSINNGKYTQRSTTKSYIILD